MINALEVYRRLKGEYDKTDQPLRERSSILPFGQYEDGSVGLAWPEILAAPAEGIANFGQYGYGEEAVPYNSRMAFDAAGGAMTGGLGVGLAGGMVDNAVGSAGGKLAQSADLPMDLASRMARAKEMGFDTDRVLYHGTGKTFDEFAPGVRANGSARNIYLTDNPEIADIYANSPNYGLKGGGDPMIYPVFAKSEKPLIVSDKGPDGSFGWVSDNLAAALGVDHPPPGRYASLYDEARRQGYDQVQIREMTDLGGDQTQYIPLDSRNIRSVNAAFDPAKSDSANLLAANPYTAAAIPAGMEASDTDPALLEYLKLYGL